MSVLTIVAFVSSMSAAIFVGPRVYAAMAEDAGRRAAGPGPGAAS